VRQVQNLRKDSGLRVEDRIRIAIDGSEDIQNALNLNKEYFLNEVLGVEIISGINNMDHVRNAKIHGLSIKFGISKVV